MSSSELDRNGMRLPLLPLDCLVEVIDNTNDPGTLFSFLTVSRTAFRFAVSKLYKDPFAWCHWNIRSASAFAHLILSISPANNKLVKKRRKQLKAKYPCQNAPFTDYLSLIVSFMFVQYEPRNCPWSHMSTDIRPVLTYAAAGHRLAEVKDLTVTQDYFEFCMARLHQLTSLKQVTFAPASPLTMQQINLFVRRFIALHDAQGPRLRVEICNILQQDRTIVLDTLSLLDPGRNPYRTITNKNALYCIAQHHRMDLGRITTIEWDLHEEEHHLLDILPKCHSLKSLTLHLYDNNIRTLGWASCERRSAHAQDQSTPPAPLESLTISGHCLATMNALNDGLKGFGSSLKQVKVEFTSWGDSSEDVSTVLRIAPGLQLPNLRQLTMFNILQNVSVSFQVDPMPRMPLLQNLQCNNLHHASPHLTNAPQHDLLTTCGPLYLPWLTQLQLTDQAVAEFNPASFHSMTNLQSLKLTLSYAWEDFWPADRWTWRWYLPVKTLVLKGLVATAFHFGAFSQLPELESLSLDFWDAKLSLATPFAEQYPVLSDCRHSRDCSTPALSKALTSLAMIGKGLRVYLPMWLLILGPWFPELKTLEFDGFSLGFEKYIVRLCARRLHKVTFNGEPVSGLTRKKKR